MVSVDLPPPETPVTQVNVPSGNSAVTSLQVVAGGALDHARFLPLPLRRVVGIGISRAPGRYWPVIELALRRDVVRRALGDDLAAVLARRRGRCR